MATFNKINLFICLKIIFLFCIIFSFGLSKVYITLDNDNYIIFTDHYVVSFNKSNIQEGININNVFNYVFLNNNEKLLSPISLKQGEYENFNFKILSNFGKYTFNFYNDYFTLSGIKTNKYQKQENIIYLIKNKIKNQKESPLLKTVTFKDKIVFLDGDFNNGYVLAIRFNKKKFNKTEYLLNKGKYYFLDPPNKEFNYLFYPFYVGIKKGNDLLINEKYFNLPNTSLKTKNLIYFIQNMKINKTQKRDFYKFDIFPLLYIKKVCINSNILCRIYVMSNEYGLEYYDTLEKKWKKVVLNRLNNMSTKKILYKEPIANFIMVKKNNIKDFTFNLKEVDFIGSKDPRILLILFIVIIFFIIYSIMHLMNKYLFNYDFKIKEDNFNGEYIILSEPTIKENKIVFDIFNYIKNNKNVNVNKLSKELDLSKNIVISYLDYMIKKKYIKLKKGENDG